MIPKEAFTEIIKELERQPIPENRYRVTSGQGRSQAFGLTNRRCLPPDYSRNCWSRPLLYKHLLDFASTYVDLSYNAITLNQDYQALPHRDKGNKGDSYLVAFGDYTGGELNILEGDLSGNHNICHNPIITDFSKVLHSVSNFTGHRYSLVYYTLKKEVNLPPPSVRFENNKYYFYRGGEKITRAKGLPHPLRKIKPSKEKKLSGIIKEVKNLTLTFD
jgi:hypothetical protein